MQEQPMKFVNAQVTNDDYEALSKIAERDAEISGATSINLSATIRRLIRQEARRFSDERLTLQS